MVLVKKEKVFLNKNSIKLLLVLRLSNYLPVSLGNSYKDSSFKDNSFKYNSFKDN
jgi:hypothetical protein